MCRTTIPDGAGEMMEIVALNLPESEPARLVGTSRAGTPAPCSAGRVRGPMQDLVGAGAVGRKPIAVSSPPARPLQTDRQTDRQTE
jgi:hypothetical protein